MEIQPSVFKQVHWPFEDNVTSLFYNKDHRLYIGTYKDGLFVSDNNGIDWVKSANFKSIYTIVSIGNTLIISTYEEGIVISTDNGSNWKVLETVGLDGGGNLFEKDDNLYCYYNWEIYFSNDGGLNWTLIFDIIKAGYPPSRSLKVTSMGKIYNDIFVGTGLGLYVSKNGGDTWSKVNNGFMPHNNPNYPAIQSIISLGLNLFVVGGVTDDAGFSVQALFISNNFGASWSKISPDNIQISSVLTIGQIIFAGTNKGVIISQDNGKSWVSFTDGLDPEFIMVHNIFSYNNTIIVKAYGNAVYRIYIADIGEYLLNSEIKPVNISKIETSGVVSFRNKSNKTMYFYKYITLPNSTYSFCEKSEYVEAITPDGTSRTTEIPPGGFLDARFFSLEQCNEDNVLSESPVTHDQADGQVIDIYANKRH